MNIHTRFVSFRHPNVLDRTNNAAPQEDVPGQRLSMQSLACLIGVIELRSGNEVNCSNNNNNNNM